MQQFKPQFMAASTVTHAPRPARNACARMTLDVVGNEKFPAFQKRSDGSRFSDDVQVIRAQAFLAGRGAV